MTPSTTSPEHPNTKGNPAPHKLLRVLLPMAFWLLIWQLGAMWVGRAAIHSAWAAGDSAALLDAVLRGKELFLPGPAAVLRSLGTLAGTAFFWQSALLSLERIFAGFLAGAVLGAVLAVFCAAFRWADALLSPAVAVIRATPVASFIILLLLWVATNRVPTVCSALMVLPVVWGNVRKGVGETDPFLLEAARAYRFTAWKTVRLVYVPSVLPYFASGCSTALGLAWKAGIAAEVLCLPKTAIGTQIFNSKRYLETPDLFAWTLVVLLLSFLLDRVFGALFHRMERGRRG